jgi:hypothetical protein
MKKETKKSSTGSVTDDKARIDRLKEQLRSTPAEVDFERVRIYGRGVRRHRRLPADHP